MTMRHSVLLVVLFVVIGESLGLKVGNSPFHRNLNSVVGYASSFCTLLKVPVRSSKSMRIMGISKSFTCSLTKVPTRSMLVSNTASFSNINDDVSISPSVNILNNNECNLDSAHRRMIDSGGKDPLKDSFDVVVNARYSCTRFQRYQEPPNAHRIQNQGTVNDTNSLTARIPSASLSNPDIIDKVIECLALSQRSPTSFNVQPYRVIMVHEREKKEQLSQYCIGKNANRVLDSDCTVVFMADRESGRDWKRFRKMLLNKAYDESPGAKAWDEPNLISNSTSTSEGPKSTRSSRLDPSKSLLKMRLIILLFSSGYPFPQVISQPLSFLIRLGVSILSKFMRMIHSLQLKSSQSTSTILKYLFSLLIPQKIQMLPTLASSNTWAQKNTMLAAMVYMLACTSRGLATCPMEGFDASGVRRVLHIPRRFTIPLIVCTGLPYLREREGEIEEKPFDDVGVSHGIGRMKRSSRYIFGDVVFDNDFGRTQTK